MTRHAHIQITASVAALAFGAPGSAAPDAAMLAAQLLGAHPAATMHSSQPPLPRAGKRDSVHLRGEETRKSALQSAESGDGVPISPGEVHPWSDGDIYRLATAPGIVTDVMLEPGETVVSVAAGDTSRWIVGDTASGSGPSRRAHVLVKPTTIGLATNLLIATDRRVYHLELRSGAAGAVSSYSWTYPRDALLALTRDLPASREAPAVPTSLEALNFNYRVEGDTPAWRPVRVFDDGRQVFVEFPPSFDASEAPPFFIEGEGGKAELVNYRLRGRFYVIDQLFDVGELRLGEKHQLVVRIIREHANQARRAS